MKIINYTDLTEFKETANELGQEKEITETSMSYSFRIFKGRTCTELHILHVANIKDKKPEPKPLAVTASAGVSPSGSGFNYNDGGRKDAGFKGHAGDCVCRAIAIVTGRPYKEIYDALASGNAMQRKTKRSAASSGKKTAASGINTTRKWFKDYMTSLGFKWVPTMTIGSGCKVHLKASELPAGRLVVSVSKHFTSVIDGIINDTHNPAERGSTVYPLTFPEDKLPKGAKLMENGNGYVYAPERCVYGYYLLTSKS